VIELLPVAEVLPTWTGCVALVYCTTVGVRIPTPRADALRALLGITVPILQALLELRQDRNSRVQYPMREQWKPSQLTDQQSRLYSSLASIPTSLAALDRGSGAINQLGLRDL